jgi:RNA polymerase sigma factor (TIGR02999 family)
VSGSSNPEPGPEQLNERGRFFGAAALAMRRTMVERARHRAKVQGAAAKREPVLERSLTGSEEGPGLLVLDALLDQLEKRDARRYQVVMLRYFGSLTVEETAAALDLTPAAVTREWTVARAWLQAEQARGEAGQAR